MLQLFRLTPSTGANSSHAPDRSPAAASRPRRPCMENLMSVEPFVETTQSASVGQIVEAPVSLSSYLTVSAVADYLSISKMTVYRLVHSGEMPAARFGKSVRISPADLEQYRQRSAVVIRRPCVRLSPKL